MSGHVSVLYEQVLAALPLAEGKWFVDGTLAEAATLKGF